MHALRFLDTSRGRIEQNFQYLLAELLSELYDDPERECLQFPSEEMLDMLQLYETPERRQVTAILKDYAEGIRSIWCEYSLTSLMTLKPYLNCDTVCRGDLLLAQTPSSSRTAHELPL